MTRTEQDRLWNDLSEENQTEMRTKYAEFSRKDDPQSKGYCQGIANVFGKHNLNPALTYEDVARELFGENNEKQKGTFCCPVFSENHCDKISAINSLICVAKFLNKNEDGSDWVPDWNNQTSKFYFVIDSNEIMIYDAEVCFAPVYFRTEALAKQAIQILGEDVVWTALTAEY